MYDIRLSQRQQNHIKDLQNEATRENEAASAEPDPPMWLRIFGPDEDHLSAQLTTASGVGWECTLPA